MIMATLKNITACCSNMSLTLKHILEERQENDLMHINPKTYFPKKTLAPLGRTYGTLREVPVPKRQPGNVPVP